MTDQERQLNEQLTGRVAALELLTAQALALGFAEMPAHAAVDLAGDLAIEVEQRWARLGSSVAQRAALDATDRVTSSALATAHTLREHEQVNRGK